jgi:probable HAF family extracellular repeat protein
MAYFSMLVKGAAASAVGVLLAACSHSGGVTPPKVNELSAQSNSTNVVRYKVIDLGTLGGPTAYGSINGNGTRVLNNAGIVAAAADTALPDPFAPLCFHDCFAVHAFRWQDGTMTDLGVLPKGGNSAAGDLNARGWAIGQSQNGQTEFGAPATRPTLWNGASIIDLGTFGGVGGAATTINDDGQVTGFSETTIPDPVFGGVEIHDFLWEHGKLRDLGTLGGPDTLPLEPEGCGTCINNRGQIAGSSFTNSVPNATTGVPTYDPFLWQNGRMIDLGTLGGTFGGPYRMNDRGQVVGTSDVAGDVATHPFIWDKGVMRDLGTLGGDNGVANWINENGEVVGFADLSGDQSHHAFLWRAGTMSDLGTLGMTSAAFAINAKHQIVGHSRINSTTVHAVLWDASGVINDLNTLVPANTPLVLVDASDINDRGEIFASAAPLGAPAEPEQIGNHDVLLVPCGNSLNSDCAARTSLTSAAGIYPRGAQQPRPMLSAPTLRKRFIKGLHVPAMRRAETP